MAKKSEKSDTEIPFEEALQKLESLVQNMERGKTPLTEMISQYQEGSALLKICQTRLQEAELTIQKLTGKKGDDFQLEPLDN